MSVSLLPGIIPEFLIQGVPASGGLLYTYAAGTTTKLATYTDSTGSTPQTNPIVLNARGEPQNTLGNSVGLWLTNSTAYKFVLSPSTDTDPPTNAIWTIDNITAGQLTGTSYTASGTNAIALTPTNNTPTPVAYANYNTYVFAAPATSTGPVTIQVGSLGYLNAYINGVQATTGQIQSGEVVIAVYNSVLNSGAGGFALYLSINSQPVVYGPDTGSANAYVVNPTFVLSALTTGQVVVFLAANANTTASTINVSGLGSKSIVNLSGGALISGQIAAGQACVCVYNGTAFQLVNPNLSNPTFASIVSPIIQGAALAGPFRNLAGSQLTASVKTSAWTADAILMEDSSNNVVRATNVNVTLNLASAGAVNTLDTGSVAASTWYYVWAISNGSSAGVLASLSATAPTLPSGYIYKTLIGAVLTDGSSNVVTFTQYGRNWQYQTPAVVGASISSSASYNLVSLKFVPANAYRAYGSVNPAITGGNYAYIGTASGSSNYVAGVQTNAGAGGIAQYNIGLISQSIYVTVSGTTSVTVSGFEINL